jgi:hypothetical protein
MPCYDPRDHEEEKRAIEIRNKSAAEQSIFHSSATPLLCEACELLEHHRLLGMASPALQAFFRKHTEHDRVRIREKYLSLRGEERSAFVKSLTHREQVMLATASE